MNFAKIIILSLMCFSGLSGGLNFSRQKQEGFGADLGKNAGVGAVLTIAGYFSKTGAWIKAAAIVSAPYAAGGGSSCGSWLRRI